jgi:hypothetical protein
MPIENFVDYRKNKYDIKVDVVFEPSWQDNSISGSTKFGKSKGDEFSCDHLYNTTISEAIKFAKKWKCPITMYVYDLKSYPVGKN